MRPSLYQITDNLKNWGEKAAETPYIASLTAVATGTDTHFT